MTRRCLRHRVLALGMALGVVAIPGVARAQSALEQLEGVIASLPTGLFELADLDVTSQVGGTTTATAVTTLLGARTDVLFSVSGATGARGYTIGLRPDDWSLAKALPNLSLPALEGLTLSNVGLVITGDSVSRSSEEMSAGEYGFYADLLKADAFTLELRPGINLFASIPADSLPADHPLVGIMNALGIEKGVVRIQGTLGRSLAMLGQPGAGGMDAIRDIYLRAELPPMRPPGSPEWFRSGQLALEITGDPSVRLVGEMAVRVQEDDLAFFLSAMLARQGVSLAGGLKAEQGWEQPFGIQWLTLYKVVLKIGLTTAGSVQLGFGGDLKIGEKDMSVAVAVAVSPAGVPTNFIFEGESESGFGISDLATLQSRMAAARAEAGGPSASAAIPIDALPAVEFRDVALKFAPKDEPDLGVTRGMAIKGRMLLGDGAEESLTEMASVDVNVGEDGFWVRGKLAAYSIGPLTWQDALLDLTATRELQRLRLSGDVLLLGARQKVDLDMSRTELRFHSLTELFGLFTAQMDATAAFNLRQPKFRVHAVAESDLGDALQPIIRGGATAFANATGTVISGADQAIAGIRTALARADATVDELQAALEAQRNRARANLEAAERDAAPLARDVAAARVARDRARNLWADTPLRQASLKASRRNDWLRAVARYNALAARAAGQAVVVSAARRILDALPPPDRSVVVLGARAAADAIRRQLETAERNLETLRQTHQAFVAALAQGGTLIAISRAEVTTDLEALRGGQALSWRITGTFVNEPFDISASVDFSQPAAAAGALLSRLIHG